MLKECGPLLGEQNPRWQRSPPSLHLDTAGPCVFLSAEAPSNIKASVRRVPAFPCLPSQPPPSQPKFDWPPARVSANSSALCADVAHDQFWHQRPSFQCHPHLYCWPVLPKNRLVPKRRHSARPGTTASLVVLVSAKGFVWCPSGYSVAAVGTVSELRHM